MDQPPGRIKAIDRLGWAMAGWSLVVGLGFIVLAFRVDREGYGALRIDGLSTASRVAGNPFGELGFAAAVVLAVVGAVAVRASPRHKRLALGAIASTAMAATAAAWVGVGAPLLRWDRHMHAIADAIASAPADDPFAGYWTGEHVVLSISPNGLSARQHSSCFGTTSRRIGTATFERTRVVIEWKDESDALFPVSWGARRYLVSDEYPLLFCASVRATSYDFGVYRRQGTMRARPTGFPIAPVDDLRCLGGNAVKASLNAILQAWAPDGEMLSATFQMDAGWAELVFLRRPFNLLTPDGKPTKWRALPVYPRESHRSAIRVTVGVGDERPGVGWAVESTVEDELAEYRPVPASSDGGGDGDPMLR